MGIPLLGFVSMPQSSPNSFISLAISPQVALTALKVSLVVGSLLALINHGSAVIAGDVTTDRLLQMALTYFVPYCVSTYSAVKALRSQTKNNNCE
ncbi:MAG: hypothetical protein ACI93R_001069 [Flavobacteriales bacterium]|jgi:hypothetical protein